MPHPLLHRLLEPLPRTCRVGPVSMLRLSTVSLIRRPCSKLRALSMDRSVEPVLLIDVDSGERTKENNGSKSSMEVHAGSELDSSSSGSNSDSDNWNGSPSTSGSSSNRDSNRNSRSSSHSSSSSGISSSSSSNTSISSQDVHGESDSMLKEAHATKLARMQEAVRCLLKGLGEDTEREGLRDTPKRVAKALLDTTLGYRTHPISVLGSALFNEDIVKQGDSGVVLVRDIDFCSTSETSFLPFHGRCHIAYIPTNGVVLGLSKFVRLTKQCAKKLTSQERLGREVAHLLQHHLSAAGVAVIIQARQMSYEGQMPLQQPPCQLTSACVVGCFGSKESTDLQDMLTLLNIYNLDDSNIERLDMGLASTAASAPITASATSTAPTAPTTFTIPTASTTSTASSGANSREALTYSSLNGSAPPCSSSSGSGDVSSSYASGGHSRRSSSSVLLSGSGGPSVGGLGSGLDAAGQSGGSFIPSTHVVTAMESAVRQLLVEVGEDPSRQGLEHTCRSYVASLLLSTSGYHIKQLPQSEVEAGTSGKPVEAEAQQQQHKSVHRSHFCSQCEHHMLPFYGEIMVAVVKGGTVSDLHGAQLDKVVAMFTQRLQVQERITHQVADAAMAVTGADGVMVVVCATHMCMVARGVENHAGATTSVATRGLFKSDPMLRNRVLTDFATGGR